jgi:L-ribulose-5-phosphate 4-epimerase
MTDIATARQSLIDAGLVLEHLGHGDMTRGHVSIRVPGKPEHFFMKPHSVGLGEITEENILTFDLESEIVAGTSRPHSERYIHSEIFRARPDVNAVIHTHPVHTVAFAATTQKMKALSQGGAIFKDAMPVYQDTINLIRSKETGRGVAEALGKHSVVVMRSHGIAMAGASIAEAVVLCVMLEEAAKIQLLAVSGGLDAWEYPDADVASLRANLMRPDQFVVNFDYLVRMAKRAR